MRLLLRLSCEIFIILVCFFGIYIQQAYAANENYLQTQALQTKAIQLQQEAIAVIGGLPNLSETEIAGVAQNPSQMSISLFPIASTLMTPGAITRYKLDSSISITQPIFLIGSDDLSKQWLKQNLNQLHQLHAIGFLVQAQDQAELTEMQNLADGLTLAPMSGDSFAQAWQLEHYPVLISSQGITQ